MNIALWQTPTLFITYILSPPSPFYPSTAPHIFPSLKACEEKKKEDHEEGVVERQQLKRRKRQKKKKRGKGDGGGGGSQRVRG